MKSPNAQPYHGFTKRSNHAPSLFMLVMKYVSWECVESLTQRKYVAIRSKKGVKTTGIDSKIEIRSGSAEKS